MGSFPFSRPRDHTLAFKNIRTVLHSVVGRIMITPSLHPYCRFRGYRTADISSLVVVQKCVGAQLEKK